MQCSLHNYGVCNQFSPLLWYGYCPWTWRYLVEQRRDARLDGLTKLQSPSFDLLTNEYLLFDGFFSEQLPKNLNVCPLVAFCACQQGLISVPDQTCSLTLLETCFGLVAFPLLQSTMAMPVLSHSVPSVSSSFCVTLGSSLNHEDSYERWLFDWSVLMQTQSYIFHQILKQIA